MAAQNAIVSIAKKVKDNVLHVMTMLVTTMQFAALQNPVANPLSALLREPPSTLLREPNTLVIK